MQSNMSNFRPKNKKKRPSHKVETVHHSFVAGGWGVGSGWRRLFICGPICWVVFIVARVGVAGCGVGCVRSCADVEEKMSGGHCARSRDQDASAAAHGVQFVVGEWMDGWGW
jgi:hypothetical protein